MRYIHNSAMIIYSRLQFQFSNRHITIIQIITALGGNPREHTLHTTSSATSGNILTVVFCKVYIYMSDTTN